MGRNIALIATVIYFVSSAVTIHLTSNGSNIATLWPANAALLAVLIDRPLGRAWLSILSAGFFAGGAANLLTRGINAGSIAYGFCNLLEVVIAGVALRSTIRGEGILGAPAIVGRFIVVAGIVAPAMSGICGASVALYFFGEPFRDAFATWFATDALGLLLFTPFFRAAFRGEYVTWFASRSWLGRIEVLGHLILAAGLAVVTFFVAARPLLFVLFAPVMLSTCRVGRLGTKASVVVIAIVGAVAMYQPAGPIVGLSSDPREQTLLFQAYLACLMLTCLPAAADLTANRNRAKVLADQAVEFRQREANLTNLAERDALTGTLNRRAFRDRVENEMQGGARSLCLIALDLDDFKSVNDGHGHQAGDMALVQVVRTLQSELRGPDVLGRVGGDEFLILVPAADQDSAERVAERLRHAVRSCPLRIDPDVVLMLTISTGTAVYESGSSYDDFTHKADLNLYRNKRFRLRSERVA